VVHVLVVEVGVGLEGFGCRGGTSGEGFCAEFGNGIVTDELSRLVLRSVSWTPLDCVGRKNAVRQGRV
jgi:hypothetical protein